MKDYEDRPDACKKLYKQTQWWWAGIQVEPLPVWTSLIFLFLEYGKPHILGAADLILF